jgi:thymidylate synthase
MVRDERLHMVVSMRSNDAFKGLPHDVFSFTMMQEIAARMLEVDLGEYAHFASSLHLYDEDAGAAEAFLKEGVQGRIGAAMPPMPPGSPWPAIRTFLRAEAAIRAGHTPDDSVNSLQSYWQDLVRLLRVFRHWKVNEPDAITRIKNEMPVRFYKEYIAMREAAG